ncbi:hypothetical protein GCM10009864_42700 [Streptomyces lunalinharesii]|uniref:Uncharacterized protein n=1 Tax=Streptomyces lunalinharesii TaxID=333384 RepID=A0ABP6EJ44_9ACTN
MGACPEGVPRARGAGRAPSGPWTVGVRSVRRGRALSAPVGACLGWSAVRRRGGERQGRAGPERAADGRPQGHRGTAFGVAVVVGVAALALLLVMCGAGGAHGVPPPRPGRPLTAQWPGVAPTGAETGRTPTRGARWKEPHPWSRRPEPP